MCCLRSGFFVVGLATRKVRGELKKAVILNLFQDLHLGSLVVVVILESRSPGSVVIKTRNRYWTKTFPYDLYFYKHPTAQSVDPEINSG